MSEHKKRIKGQLFFLLTILLISAVRFSNQKAGPPVTLPLGLPYLPYITSVGSGDVWMDGMAWRVEMDTLCHRYTTLLSIVMVSVSDG